MTSPSDSSAATQRDADPPIHPRVFSAITEGWPLRRRLRVKWLTFKLRVELKAKVWRP